MGVKGAMSVRVRVCVRMYVLHMPVPLAEGWL